MNFSDSDLSGANLTRTKLFQSDFTRALLDGADFRESSIEETKFVDVNLSNSKDLDKCLHKGHSIVDHRTLMKSGTLPYSFLRGCGFPERLIDYLPALFGEAIQFYSCFISYSSQDENFARRLHADLQNHGIRCWFAPHDLPIGARTQDTIDQAIRIAEKVIVVLSTASTQSDWLEEEVESALFQERRRQEIVLFPIRLDNSIFAAEQAWVRSIRDARNIGDFTEWKQHDSYQNSLQRLIRDLRR